MLGYGEGDWDGRLSRQGIFGGVLISNGGVRGIAEHRVGLAGDRLWRRRGNYLRRRRFGLRLGQSGLLLKIGEKPVEIAPVDRRGLFSGDGELGLARTPLSPFGNRLLFGISHLPGFSYFAAEMPPLSLSK